MPRILKIAIAALAVASLVAVAALGVGAWYISDILRNDALVPDTAEAAFDLRVAAVSDGRVTLRATSETDLDGDWKSDGVWGLEWKSGYAQVGAVVGETSDEVVRELASLNGSPEPGVLARLDSYAFPVDPLAAHGLAFDEVRYSSPAGEFDAWLLEGSRPTWAIFVHGKGADRRESLRMLPAVVAEGLPSLVITYRNDAGAPRSESGYYGYGAAEWEDLEGAAEYALSHGARDLVLVGYSMGGAIVASFLFESALADRVRGVILDAPMMDFNETVAHGAREKGIPSFIVGMSKWMAGLRFGVDFGALDYLRRTSELEAPILLFHGDDDRTVPVGTSDALAKARPDIVTYIRTSGAGHVRSWNTGHVAYQAAVRRFLRGLGGG